MALPMAQLKGLIDELSKMKGGKPIAKALNNLIFRPSDEEVAQMNPQLQQGLMANPSGQADLGMGQSSNVVGNSQIVGPAHGPGGV